MGVWLVVATHLKNMLVKLDHFLQERGEHINVWNQHLDSIVGCFVSINSCLLAIINLPIVHQLHLSRFCAVKHAVPFQAETGSVHRFRAVRSRPFFHSKVAFPPKDAKPSMGLYLRKVVKTRRVDKKNIRKSLGLGFLSQNLWCLIWSSSVSILKIQSWRIAQWTIPFLMKWNATRSLTHLLKAPGCVRLPFYYPVELVAFSDSQEKNKLGVHQILRENNQNGSN